MNKIQLQFSVILSYDLIKKLWWVFVIVFILILRLDL